MMLTVRQQRGARVVHPRYGTGGQTIARPFLPGIRAGVEHYRRHERLSSIRLPDRKCRVSVSCGTCAHEDG